MTYIYWKRMLQNYKKHLEEYEVMSINTNISRYRVEYFLHTTQI